ncbi:MAG: division/cell wall cluster transcriptional repressor MraZ [Thermomicrobiales bacterium]
MFLGRFEHTLDIKGRIAIPAKFRADLVEGLIMTRGIDRCLAVYPMAAWQDLAARMNALSMADPNARLMRRMVFSEAMDAMLDGQGRVLVPGDLRVYAGIEREAIVVGLHSSFEIWNPERWRDVNATVEATGAAIAAQIADLL